MAETIPHLKDGAQKDFISIMTDRGYWKDSNWNKSDRTYTFETGTELKFKSVDKLGKARGPRRDGLFINEADTIPYEIADQLMVRTKEFIWLDWNPTHEFWYYSELKDMVDHDFITLTYKDCLDILDPRIVEGIEAHKENKNWWRVYGLGLLGELEGKIYKGWKEIDEIPHEARLIARGLDFGYSVDPTALVDIYRWNGGFILNERLYQKGMSNAEIAKFIKMLEEPQTIVMADSAEPKSIDEIMSYGVTILGAQKGQGSINQGIQYVQAQKIWVTKRSTHLLKEYRNYLWREDKDGKILNVPIDMFNHCMDAIRYGFDGQLQAHLPPTKPKKPHVKLTKYG